MIAKRQIRQVDIYHDFNKNKEEKDRTNYFEGLNFDEDIILIHNQSIPITLSNCTFNSIRFSNSDYEHKIIIFDNCSFRSIFLDNVKNFHSLDIWNSKSIKYLHINNIIVSDKIRISVSNIKKIRISGNNTIANGLEIFGMYHNEIIDEINIDCSYFNNLKITGGKINVIGFSKAIYNGNIQFNGSQINEIYFKEWINYGNIYFINHNYNVDTLKIENSDLGNTVLTGYNFKESKNIEIYFSQIQNIKLQSSIFPKRLKHVLPSEREYFSQLKNAAKKENDFLKEEYYKMLELNSMKRGLSPIIHLNKEYLQNIGYFKRNFGFLTLPFIFIGNIYKYPWSKFFDYVNLFLQKYMSNFTTNWIQPILIYLFLNGLSLWLIMSWSQISIEDLNYKTLYKLYFDYLLPTHNIFKYNESIGFSFGSALIEFVQRIADGILIFHIITAFRKFNKK